MDSVYQTSVPKTIKAISVARIPVIKRIKPPVLNYIVVLPFSSLQKVLALAFEQKDGHPMMGGQDSNCGPKLVKRKKGFSARKIRQSTRDLIAKIASFLF